MNKTKLYLDVDGVINAWYANKHWPDMQSGLATASNGTFTIKWSAEMIRQLSTLDVELVWATTWKAEARSSLSPLIEYAPGLTARNLDSIPGTYSPFRMRSSIEWKQPAVADDQIQDESPFIWIDDEHNPDTVRWAALKGGLAIWTHPDLGIVPESIQLMKEYIAAMEAEDEDV